MDVKENDRIFIGEGTVVHTRPPRIDVMGRWGGLVKNSFRYSIFNLLIPITKNTSHTVQYGFLSVSSKNYLDGSHSSFHDGIHQFLRENADYSCDEVWLQTLPKMFGYVFNPVSFWFCYKEERLDAVLCEVNNTFGDRHFYFVNHLEGEKPVTRELKKEFHDSPFLDIKGDYLFTFKKDINESDVRILLYREGSLDLATHIQLKLSPLHESSPFQIFCTYGWMTAMVILRIHWQALKLWWKGASFFSRPKPPKNRLTVLK